jgi:serine/threonine-protein kinase
VRPGEVLAGKYRVERTLGSGGMGYVVAARHLQLDQLVAMKFLRTGVNDNTEATARFLREAKAAVKLKNEHIAKVFDVGTLETREPYMVMEYLEGSDLSALLKQRGTIGAHEAADYVLQACEALAEAHGLGIIHRDIKLANLFVTRGATGAPLVKVLDFGVSKTNPFGESEHDMTRTSSMLGSPRFMSPEQMRDPRAVDGRTDIWSLGVCLYRMVAGRAPFEADTLGRLLTMVMHEIPDRLSKLRPDIPPGFEQVVMRCLEKDPQARFTSVAELAYALVPFVGDQARARAQADRIAQVQSVAPPPTSSVSLSDISQGATRPSGPPQVVDTGTAAPWAGTHGSGKSRSPTIAIGIGLAALAFGVVGGALILASSRSAPAGDRAAAAAAPTEPPAVVTMAPPPAADPPPPPISTAVVPTPVTALPTAAAPPPPPKAAARPPTPARKPAARPPKNEDGIPTTRD